MGNNFAYRTGGKACLNRCRIRRIRGLEVVFLTTSKKKEQKEAEEDCIRLVVKSHFVKGLIDYKNSGNW
jgi:hypothetical protein